MVSVAFLLPVVVVAVHTPQGERDAACVVEVPETSAVKTTDVGIAVHHEDGSVDHHETPVHCHNDVVALTLAGAMAPNEWIDQASFANNAGFSKMTGFNNIPDTPTSEPGTDYWFLGMCNMRGGPLSILQPVLTYKQHQWTAASWACCPSNITTTGNTIGPFRTGDRMYGSMIRKDASTWEIITQVNGQTSRLNAQVGPWTYQWAVGTFEDYGVTSCSQLPHQAVTFDTVKLYDESGGLVHPQWSPSGRTMCSGRITSPNENTISIQHSASEVAV